MQPPSDETTEQIRARWNRLAAEWQIQVGDDGDRNRILNSDPVLWAMAGNVQGRRVLDAGCGTGYLSRQLHARGAIVTGIDLSDQMVDIARKQAGDITFLVDSCSQLRHISDATIDLVISNYVLMDTPDLEGTLQAFHRVLRPGGEAILIFSHPCFPQGRATVSSGTKQVSYHWTSSYFARTTHVEPPWGHFTAEFQWFHRPLSDYWKAFLGAGFQVMDLEEPRLTQDRYHLADSPKAIANNRTRPYSIAFRLMRAL